MDDDRHVPFGDDESYREVLLSLFKGGEEVEEGDGYREFLLILFNEGEEGDEHRKSGEDEEEEEGPLFQIVEQSTEIEEVVTQEDDDHHVPFGDDESYREVLLSLFKEGGEEVEEGDGYREFLLILFNEGEEGDEHRKSGEDEEEEEGPLFEIVEQYTEIDEVVTREDDDRHVPFGDDESYREVLLSLFKEGGEEVEEGDGYREFLLILFNEGEEGDEHGKSGEDEEEEEGPLFEIVEQSTEIEEAVTREDDDCHVPFGDDESYREVLLSLFKEGGEEVEEGDGYREFLLILFNEGEEGDEHGKSGEDEEEEEGPLFEIVEQSTEIEEVVTHELGRELEDIEIEVNNNVQRNPIEEVKPRWNKHAATYTFSASIICIFLGFVIGLMSKGIAYVKPDQPTNDEFEDHLIGVSKLSSLIGLILAWWIPNKIAYRYKIGSIAIIFFIGALFVAIKHAYIILVIGRFIINIAASYTLIIVPIYIAEISPVSYRGLLTSFPEVFINVGTLLSDVSHFFLFRIRSNLGWRLLLSIGGIPFLLIAWVLAMPESPQWLIMQGRQGDAKRVLAQISNSEEEATVQLAKIKEAVGIPEENNDNIIEVTDQSAWGDMWRDLHWTSPTLHMLACTIGIYFIQQASGSDTIILYSPSIFDRASIISNTTKLLLAIALDVVKIICTLLAAFLLDRIGRRPLLLTSIGGMIISLASLGTCLTVIDQSQGVVKWAPTICFLLLVCYVAFFSVGMGPIASIYSSEVFPLRLRVRGCAIGVAVSQLASGLISFGFVFYFQKITLGGLPFFIFMVVSILAWVYFYLIMPESKGRNLEQMAELFGKWIHWRSSVREREGRRSSATEGA